MMIPAKKGRRVKLPVLARDERETTITFDETPDDAVIFTYSRVWQRHLERKLGLKPIMNNGFGAKEYRIPKNRIKPPRAPKRLSAATLQRLRKQGKTLHQKSAVPPRKGTVQPKFQGKTSVEGNPSNRTKTKSKNPQKSAVNKL